jgi:hypothetical protein
MRAVYARTPHRASEMVGLHQLAISLGVSVETLTAWMAGAGEPPLAVFLKAVDIVCNDNIAGISTTDKARAKNKKPATEGGP